MIFNNEKQDISLKTSVVVVYIAIIIFSFNVTVMFLLQPNNFFCFKFPDTCTAVIIPLVQKFCDEIPKQCSESLLTVAKLFGKLSYGLSGKNGYSFLKGGVHGSAHVHESKYFFAFARYDPSLFNLIHCL